MAVVLKKYLPSEQATIPGVDSWGGKVFLPLYKIYDDDKCVATYTNIYEAARELERRTDLCELAMAYDKNPNYLKSTLPSPVTNALPSTQIIPYVEDADDLGDIGKDVIKKLVSDFWNTKAFSAMDYDKIMWTSQEVIKGILEGYINLSKLNSLV